MLYALGFPQKQQERAGLKATLVKRNPGSCGKIAPASQNGNNTKQIKISSKAWARVRSERLGDVKTDFQTLAVQSATALLAMVWDCSNETW